jgi:hypothetical protein
VLACVARASHGYLDVARLAAEHPRAAAALLRRALVRGGELDLPYLGKCMWGARCYADLAPFGVWRVLFRRLGPWLLGATLLLCSGVLVAGGRSTVPPGPARAAALLAAFGATQYLVALADGLVEYPKHVLVGNYALAGGLSLGLLAVLSVAVGQVESRLKSASGTDRIPSMIARQKPGTYTTSRRRSTARTIARATVEGGTNSGFFRMPAVIGESTKPGFTVTTRTPRRNIRFRSPARNSDSPPFDAP